ncbi:MAG: TrmB family transcriptional regulator [Candidatus Cloacimonetes bacterium]|nr:TrmB family transcriptional regulator [Candidatus Cloacimonadota bacterium]MBS3767113.1 TrmB family transcriptional regulator [Candidatus Cloacimonadota bacterium]
MKDHISELKKAGLTEYEARVYYNLLQKHDYSAKELSDQSGVPRTRIYEILNTLIQRGFCTELPGKVKRFKAINPKFAFKNLTEKLDNQLEKKLDHINALSEALTPIYQEEKDNQFSFDFVEVIREKARVEERLEELEKQAKFEIILMIKSPYLVNYKQIKALGSLKAKSQDVSYKFLCDEKDLNNYDYVEYIQIWKKIGADIRVASDIPIKLIIYDKKTSVIYLPDKVRNSNSFTSLIIEDRDFAKFIRKTFDHYFKKAVPLKKFIQKKGVIYVE